jgi:hypothetical protein
MIEEIRNAVGPELDRAAYHADFAREFAQLRGVLWKLERVQTFREPGDPSWEAFVRGDWAKALELNEQEWEGVRAEATALAEQGVENRRLRIVEYPITPYVQWEMHYFRLLGEAGFPLRVLGAEQVAHAEQAGVLPEVVILGEQVLYHVLQQDDGTPRGARRITDPQAIARVSRSVAEMYAMAEPVLDFFHREIAELPAPDPRA